MPAQLVLEAAVEALTLPEMPPIQPTRVSPIAVGHEAALDGIVLDLERRHGQALFGFVRRLGLNDAEAADAVQEALLRLWAELVAGRSIEQPKAWAFRAIYRLAMDQRGSGGWPTAAGLPSSGRQGTTGRLRRTASRDLRACPSRGSTCLG